MITNLIRAKESVVGTVSIAAMLAISIALSLGAVAGDGSDAARLVLSRLKDGLAASGNDHQRTTALETLTEALRIGKAGISSDELRQAFRSDENFRQTVTKWAWEGGDRSRLAASLAIAMIDPDEGKELLQKIVASNELDARVREIAQEAITELEAIGGGVTVMLEGLAVADAIDVLRQMLKSERERTRYLAIEGGTRMAEGYFNTRSEVVELLIDHFKVEVSVSLKRNILTSVAKIAERERVLQFLSMVEKSGMADPALRDWATQALEMMRD